MSSRPPPRSPKNLFIPPLTPVPKVSLAVRAYWASRLPESESVVTFVDVVLKSLEIEPLTFNLRVTFQVTEAVAL